MTKSQNALYWKQWSSVRRACVARGLPIPDRHELHVRALGLDKPHKDFSNVDFDQVLAEFLVISKPDDLAVQLLQRDQARRRLLYGIRQSAPEPYCRAIARDKFGIGDVASLGLEQLRQLLITLRGRWRARARKPSQATPTTT